MPSGVISFRTEDALADLAAFHADLANGRLANETLQREWAERLSAYMEFTHAAEPDAGWAGMGIDTGLGLIGFLLSVADVSSPVSVVGLVVGFLGFTSSAGKQIDANLRAGAMLALQQQIEEAQRALAAIRAATAPSPETRP